MIERALNRALIGCWVLACCLWVPGADANCVADVGDTDVIAGDGVTIVCDNSDPNPFPGGIGSVSTDTNLTVDVADSDAVIDSASVGVNLGDGGRLTNAGEIEAIDQGVLGTNLSDGDGVSVSNTGSITSAANVGVDLNLADSTVTNEGTISGETAGIRVSASTIDNDGSIEALDAAGVGIDAGAGSSIDNSGSIDSAGTGMVLGADSDAANSGTIDSEGTAVVLADGAALINTGAVTSATGVAITATTNAEIVNAGVVSGGGGDAITLSGGGNQLTLQTGSQIDGRIVSTSAGVPSDVLVLEGEGDEDDEISTFASLFMRGERWSLSGEVSALDVAVESGALTVNGTLDTRDAGLNPGLVQILGGTLRGTGTVIGNVDNVSGTVSAGDTVGTLSVVGDYVQGADGTLRVGSGAGEVGLLDVSGTATLAGTAVITAGSDGVFEFLAADGGINGGFDDVVVDGRAVVSLISTANSLSFIRASTTVEDNMVGAAIDGGILTLDSLTPGSESAGEGGAWVKLLGHLGERDESDGIAGGDFTIGGGAVGGDWALAGGTSRLGAAVGYTSTDVDIDDGSDGEADNVIYGVYYQFAGETVTAGVAIGGGSNEFDHTRSIFVGDELQQASASYDGTTVGARAEFGLTYPFRGELREHWVFEPVLRVDYVVVDLDPYTEVGGAGLRIDADDIEAVEGSLLLAARRSAVGAYGLAPRMHIGVVHQEAIDDRRWTATDVDSETTVTLQGDDDEDTALSVGVGTDFSIGRRVSGFLDYVGEFGDEADSHTFIGGLRVDL